MKYAKFSIASILISPLLISVDAHAEDTSTRIGAQVSGSLGIGQLQNSDANLKARTMHSYSVDGMLGYRFGKFMPGIHVDYRWQEQLTSLADAGGTNLKGKAYSVGIGSTYWFNQAWYGLAAVDLFGTYNFDRDTQAGEDDELRSPIILRVKAGRLLSERVPLSIDLDASYGIYNTLHVAGSDRSLKSSDWRIGVALTYHFGDRNVEPSAPKEAVVTIAPVQAVEPQANVEEKVANEPAAAVTPDLSKIAGVEKVGDVLQISLKSDSFAPGSSELSDETKESLMAAAKALAASNKKIQVEGHTDSSGNAKKNQKLSEDRATSVKKFLVENGVSDGNVTAKGFGSTVPKADNKTKEGRSANRRVEIKIIE